MHKGGCVDDGGGRGGCLGVGGLIEAALYCVVKCCRERRILSGSSSSSKQ